MTKLILFEFHYYYNSLHITVNIVIIDHHYCQKNNLSDFFKHPKTRYNIGKLHTCINLDLYHQTLHCFM